MKLEFGFLKYEPKFSQWNTVGLFFSQARFGLKFTLVRTVKGCLVSDSLEFLICS